MLFTNLEHTWVQPWPQSFRSKETSLLPVFADCMQCDLTQRAIKLLIISSKFVNRYDPSTNELWNLLKNGSHSQDTTLKNANLHFKKLFLMWVWIDLYGLVSVSYTHLDVYKRQDVYNADETGINWRALPRKSLASRREQSAPGFKVSKERITAMVCANASGEHKVKLLVIGKSKKPRCFKNVHTLPVSYTCLLYTSRCV